jgi:hypothetical protein
MKTLVVESVVNLFENTDRTYKTGMIVDFRIREDMFNSGKIEFLNKEYVKSGEMNVSVRITFAYKDLVLPFIQKDMYYAFGESSYPYGECKILYVL